MKNNNSNNKINNTNNCTKIFIFLKSRATGYPANRIQSEREIKKACWYYNNIDDEIGCTNGTISVLRFIPICSFCFQIVPSRKRGQRIWGCGGLRNGRDDFCSSEIIIQIYLMLFFLNKI